MVAVFGRRNLQMTTKDSRWDDCNSQLNTAGTRHQGDNIKNECDSTLVTMYDEHQLWQRSVIILQQNTNVRPS